MERLAGYTDRGLEAGEKRTRATLLDTLSMTCHSLLGRSSGRHDDSPEGASRHASHML